MRRPTLLEKRYGPGFRVPDAAVRFDPLRCGVLDCPDPVYGSCELLVDDKPTGRDWYSRLLAALPAAQYTRVSFCRAHLYEVGARSVGVQDEPDSWAPGRESPYVLTRPPKVKEAPRGVR